MDMHTLTGAYAAWALPDDERESFERHLRDCSSCAQEVRELQATAALLGAAAAVTPPADLKRRVLAETATVRQLPPPRAARRRTGPTRPTGWWGGPPLLVAASVLLVLSLALSAVLAVQQRRLGDAEERARAIAGVVADPRRTEATATASTGGTASVVAAGGRAVFAARDLAPLPPGRAYQLWIIADDGVRSAGLLSVEDGRAQAYLPDLGRGHALAVSDEPARGSKQPTTDPVLVLDLAA